MKIDGKEVRLPKRFKDKWVKALRSGEYTQGKYQLYSPYTNSYCCLGVAATICGKDTDEIARKCDLKELSDYKNIPKLLISTEKGGSASDLIIGKLMKFNDSGEKSFNYIAAYIERYL